VKDRILFSLVYRLKASKVKLSAHTDAHKAEVEGLKKKLAEMNKNFEVAKVKQEISEMERSRVQKNVEELHDSKERCYETSSECAKKLKIALQGWEHTLRNRNLFMVIPKGLSSGSAKRSKLLMKYSAIVGISVLSPVHEGSWPFWKKPVVSMLRLQPSQNLFSQQMTPRTPRLKPLF
jgi:hypothetical protein